MHRTRPRSQQQRHLQCSQSQQQLQPHDRRSASQACVASLAGAVVVQQAICAGAANASEAVGSLAEASATIPLALGGGAAIAALSAALIATDPQKR